MSMQYSVLVHRVGLTAAVYNMPSDLGARCNTSIVDTNQLDDEHITQLIIQVLDTLDARSSLFEQRTVLEIQSHGAECS